MKTFSLYVISSIAIGVGSLSCADGYDRKDFSYRSYKPNTSIGFYTNKIGLGGYVVGRSGEKIAKVLKQ